MLKGKKFKNFDMDNFVINLTENLNCLPELQDWGVIKTFLFVISGVQKKAKLQRTPKELFSKGE